MKVVLALALTAALTGCDSGSGTPHETTSPSVTSSTPSPSSTEDLKVVLERVVREYYTEANHALATGNVTQLDSLSVNDCSCKRLVGYIEDKYKNGSLRGAAFQIKTIRPYEVQPSRGIVQVTHDAPAYEVLDKSGRVVQKVPADHGNVEDLSLVPRDGRWLVESVVTL